MIEPSEPNPPLGLLLSDDLLFVSRISGTARDLGFPVKPARTAAVLADLARQQDPCCVLVDLANPGLDLPGLLCRLRETCARMPRVVAYGSHVDTATLRAAREAGCDVVLPRSKFVEDLPRALAEWFS
jgi:CheY-like chemotaxis protein